MQRELDWLKKFDKTEEKSKMIKMTEEELDELLKEDDEMEATENKQKIKSLDDIENSWRVPTPSKDENKDREKIGVACVICGGEILQRSFLPFIGNLDVYGPGGRNQATEIDRRIEGYHCETCGIEYHKLPPKDLFKVRSQS